MGKLEGMQKALDHNRRQLADANREIRDLIEVLNEHGFTYDIVQGKWMAPVPNAENAPPDDNMKEKVDAAAIHLMTAIEILADVTGREQQHEVIEILTSERDQERNRANRLQSSLDGLERQLAAIRSAAMGGHAVSPDIAYTNGGHLNGSR